MCSIAILPVVTWGKIASRAVAATMTAHVTATATMTDWPGCGNIPSVRGPGALIMAWFGRPALGTIWYTSN